MKKKFEVFKNWIQSNQENNNSLKQTIILTDCQSPELINKVVDGFRQLIEGKGYSMECPLENIGIDGFYYLMDIFHYVVVSQGVVISESDYCLDEMIIQDVVTEERVILYNLVMIVNEKSFNRVE